MCLHVCKTDGGLLAPIQSRCCFHLSGLIINKKNTEDLEKDVREGVCPESFPVPSQLPTSGVAACGLWLPCIPSHVKENSRIKEDKSRLSRVLAGLYASLSFVAPHLNCVCLYV